jgi:hypothetical protein
VRKNNAVLGRVLPTVNDDEKRLRPGQAIRGVVGGGIKSGISADREGHPLDNTGKTKNERDHEIA